MRAVVAKIPMPLFSASLVKEVLDRTSRWLIELFVLQLGNIRAMHAFILTHGKDYTDHYRSTEKDRDNIEHEVLLLPESKNGFVKD